MLYPYALPEDNQPDLIIELAASHAEAFNRANRAAATAMGFMMQTQGTLGILKSSQFYIAGPIDFRNNVVNGPAIEEFGDQLMLQGQRTTITELRNQMNGHIRVALNQIMSAVEATSINLIFCSGGPLVILPPQPYRIAVLRFEGAKSIEEEAQCVVANKSSRIAYQTVWAILEELISKQPRSQEAPQTDILDNPPEPATTPFKFVPKSGDAGSGSNHGEDNSRVDDEEDMLDGLDGREDSQDSERSQSSPSEDIVGDASSPSAQEGALPEFDNIPF